MANKRARSTRLGSAIKVRSLEEAQREITRLADEVSRLTTFTQFNKSEEIGPKTPIGGIQVRDVIMDDGSTGAAIFARTEKGMFQVSAGSATVPSTPTTGGGGNTSVVTDNLDGTYTHDDGTGTTTTIDTRAPSNPFVSGGSLTATNVKAALDELEGLADTNTTNIGVNTTAIGVVAADLATHEAANPAHSAANISFTPYSTIASTNVQAAIQELLDEATSGTDDQDATEVNTIAWTGWLNNGGTETPTVQAVIQRIDDAFDAGLVTAVANGGLTVSETAESHPNPALYAVKMTDGGGDGDLKYYNATNQWVNLTRGTNGQYLKSTATSIAWGALSVDPLGDPASNCDIQDPATGSGVLAWNDFDGLWEMVTATQDQVLVMGSLYWGAQKIVNAQIDATAAIDITKLNPAGTANQVVKMNSGGTALEFGTISGSGTLTIAADSGTAGEVLNDTLSFLGGNLIDTAIVDGATTTPDVTIAVKGNVSTTRTGGPPNTSGNDYSLHWYSGDQYERAWVSVFIDDTRARGTNHPDPVVMQISALSKGYLDAFDDGIIEVVAPQVEIRSKRFIVGDRIQSGFNPDSNDDRYSHLIFAAKNFTYGDTRILQYYAEGADNTAGVVLDVGSDTEQNLMSNANYDMFENDTINFVTIEGVGWTEETSDWVAHRHDWIIKRTSGGVDSIENGSTGVTEVASSGGPGDSDPVLTASIVSNQFRITMTPTSGGSGATTIGVMGEIKIRSIKMTLP